MKKTEYPDKQDFAQGTAELILKTIQQAIARRGFASVVLSGGKTPCLTYTSLSTLLVEANVPGESVYWFVGDERAVDRDNDERNEKMIRESLFQNYRPSRKNIFFWEAPPVSPVLCAALYAKLIHNFFTSSEKKPDLVLLGLGPDGHTASLFAGAEVETDAGEVISLSPDTVGPALAIRPAQGRGYRLTLSAPFIRSSAEIMFLVSGGEKQEALRRLMRGDRSMPASWVVNNNTSLHVMSE